MQYWKLTEGNEFLRAKINTSVHNVKITKVHRKANVVSASEVEDNNAGIVIDIADVKENCKANRCEKFDFVWTRET